MPRRPLRIGTRGSPMALRQTALVADGLAAAHPDLAAKGQLRLSPSPRLETECRTACSPRSAARACSPRR